MPVSHGGGPETSYKALFVADLFFSYFVQFRICAIVFLAKYAGIER
jgi:hypothetical protein